MYDFHGKNLREFSSNGFVCVWVGEWVHVQQETTTQSHLRREKEKSDGEIPAGKVV